ncbi:MAG TPA: hypothetical protein VGI53_12115 [Dyella sp.]|jgi:hypothetical protein
MSERQLPPRRLWWLTAGFIVWCSALVVLYALHAIGCAFGWSAGPLRWSLAIVLLVHLVVIAWMWRHLATATPDPELGQGAVFLQTIVVWTLIAALVATVITFAPSLVLKTCI